MFFDDIFYPDNPKRREKVAQLRAEVVISFNQYKSAWNTNTDLLNDIFAKQPSPFNIQLKHLQYDITKDTINSCIKEIQEVANDTKTSLAKLIDDIGLKEHLPENWDESGIRYDPSNIGSALNIGKLLSGVLTATLGAFVGFYVFTGITIFTVLINFAGGMISNIGSILGGAIGGIVCGAVTFVIGDMIASAITGAIQRKELNDAIDILTQLKNAVADNLNDATAAISGITLSIKNGFYALDDTHILKKQPDGSYVILSLSSNNINNLVKTPIEDGLVFICA